MREIIAAERVAQDKAYFQVKVGRYMKECQQQSLDEAIKTGKDTSTVLPHPGDIVIEDGSDFEVIGSQNEQDLDMILQDCLRRDVIILQAVLDERQGKQERKLRLAVTRFVALRWCWLSS